MHLGLVLVRQRQTFSDIPVRKGRESFIVANDTLDRSVLQNPLDKTVPQPRGGDGLSDDKFFDVYSIL